MKQQVFTKARQRFGTIYPAQATDYAVEIVKNKSIVVYKNDVLANSFNLGDTAEYDSYNLRYTGNIVAISDKRIVIESYGRNYSLDINTFCWRNHDFNAAKVAEQNFRESMYI
jgi:hypothetical protein